MGIPQQIGIFALCSMAFAADLPVTIQPGQVAERQITFSQEDLRRMPLLLVPAHPDRIVVSVVSPDGRIYSRPTRGPDTSVLIAYADAASSSWDEATLAKELKGDATMVGWNENAPPGIYKIRLTGQGTSSPQQLTLHQITADEFQEEVRAKEDAEQRAFFTSLYAGPEQRVPLDAQGNATITFEGVWHQADVILVGSTLKEGWISSVQLPDGTTITETNARQSGCDWSVARPDDQASRMMFGAEFADNQISCPTHMKAGRITVQLRAEPKAGPAQLVAAILRPNSPALAARLEDDMQADLAEMRRLVHLLHKSEDPDEQGSISTIVDHPVVIRLALSGGASPIKEAEVTGIAYTISPHSDYNLTVIGPDPMKTSTGTLRAAREPNGEFVYAFPAHQPGHNQVDFTAEGTFPNGRRFAADAAVAVFVHRKAADLTRVRQQRVNRNGGTLVRFLLDLDVVEPGRYEVFIKVGKEPNQNAYASGEQNLAAGKQTIVAEGNRGFLAKLAENPGTELNIEVTNRNPTKDGDFPSKVAMDIPIPKAGEFESPGAVR